MATDCQTCCDELECEVTAIKTNVANLFTRTDDIAAFLETVDDGSDHVYRVVHNSDELLQAIAVGGSIYIDAPIVIGSELELTIDGIQLIGMNEDAAIIRQHNNTSAINVIKISARNITIRNLKITTNHPLINNTSIHDVAIYLSDDADISGLKVITCEIHHVVHGIYRYWAGDGNAYAPEAFNCRVEHCYFHSLTQYGIYVQQKMHGFKIIYNTFVGVDQAQDSHVNNGNGIWLGNNSDYAVISYNEISYFGRHGIEYWNSQHIPSEYTDGNKSAKISYNYIHHLTNLGGGNFLITAFGNQDLTIDHNTLIGGSIGIEIYCDRVTDGEVIVESNFVKGATDQLISVNGVCNGVIRNNIFRDSDSVHGMQIIFGCRNVEIYGNKFIDAGERNIYSNGIGLTITGIQVVNNGWITVAENLSAGSNSRAFAVGQQITFKAIVGTTQLNDKYYTITEVDTSGAVGTHKIRLGIDMSAFTAWSSGGYVKESYRNITIRDNTFYHNKLIGGNDPQSMYLVDMNAVNVYHNNAWYVSTLSSDKFFYTGYTSLYIDFLGAVNTAGGYFIGLNRRTSFLASN